MVTNWPSCRPTSLMVVMGAWVTVVINLVPANETSVRARVHSCRKLDSIFAFEFHQQRRHMAGRPQRLDCLIPINCSVAGPEMGIAVAGVVVHVRREDAAFEDAKPLMYRAHQVRVAGIKTDAKIG